MKQVDGQLIQVNNVRTEQAVCSPIMKKGPVSRGSNVEDVRVRRPSLARPPELLEMDVGILAKLIDQKVPVGVVSNHAQSI